VVHVNTTGSVRGVAARWALAVALVVGVLGMHALMGPPVLAASGDAASAGMTTSTGTAREVPGGTTDAGRPALRGDGSSPTNEHSPAGGHSMLTTCLAVLSSLAAAVLLVSALARRPARVDRPAGARSVGHLSCLGRPPPWTVPSLHQLSLLRV
jgi:hypothetical protein